MNAHKTAIARGKPSRPLRYLLEIGAIEGKVLDFGCGKGRDWKELRKRGFKVTGYDPYYAPKLPKGKFNVVLMTYVVNVLKVPQRDKAIKQAWAYVRKGGLLVVTARTEADIAQAAKQGNWSKVAWGYETSTGTYQRGYTPKTLDRVVNRILDGVRTIQFGGVNAGGAMVIIRKATRSA